MEKSEIDALVEDYSLSATTSADVELRVVEAALFVEECLGISLCDEDFSLEKLGNPEALRKFIFNRSGT